jgi:hypothetical protein
MGRYGLIESPFPSEREILFYFSNYPTEKVWYGYRETPVHLSVCLSIHLDSFRSMTDFVTKVDFWSVFSDDVLQYDI